MKHTGERNFYFLLQNSGHGTCAVVYNNQKEFVMIGGYGDDVSYHGKVDRFNSNQDHLLPLELFFCYGVLLYIMTTMAQESDLE